jgi:hypothetical protein
LVEVDGEILVGAESVVEVKEEAAGVLVEVDGEILVGAESVVEELAWCLLMFLAARPV